MKFRHITRQLTRTTTYYPLSQLSQRPTLYQFQSHHFSSNLDNDKNNTVPTPTPKTETMKQMTESIQQTVKNASNNSFWNLVALDNSHKEWIDTYNKTLSKNNALSIDSFNDMRKYMQYISTNMFDFMLRFRMRGLSKHLMCYEEFMVGAINSFKSLQSINQKDKIKISRCFNSNLYDLLPEIKHALFNCNEKDKKYNIQNLQIFGKSMQLYETVGEHGMPDVEMRFNVRYYYELKNVKGVDEDMKRKCADIEWKGSFTPVIEKDEFKTFTFNDKGFLVNDVEVDEF